MRTTVKPGPWETSPESAPQALGGEGPRFPEAVRFLPEPTSSSRAWCPAGQDAQVP